MKHHLALVLCAATAVASAEDCGRLPVKTATHAICLAKEFAEQANPWDMNFEAKEHSTEWLVSYAPKSSSVRGGAGDPKIEKVSGKITVVKLYR
jgi:hypothetical protein